MPCSGATSYLAAPPPISSGAQAGRLPEPTTLLADERAAVEAHVRGRDLAGEELARIDQELARAALPRADGSRSPASTSQLRRRSSLLSATSEASPRRRSSWAMWASTCACTSRACSPRVPVPSPKQGQAHARARRAEPGRAAAKTPGPPACLLPARAAPAERTGAVAATARKPFVLTWHLLPEEQDYTWPGLSLSEKKLRSLELRAGLPARRRQHPLARGYNAKDVRERALSAAAECAYQWLVARWQPRKPKAGAGAAARERSSSLRGGALIPRPRFSARGHPRPPLLASAVPRASRGSRGTLRTSENPHARVRTTRPRALRRVRRMEPRHGCAGRSRPAPTPQSPVVAWPNSPAGSLPRRTRPRSPPGLAFPQRMPRPLLDSGIDLHPSCAGGASGRPESC